MIEAVLLPEDVAALVEQKKLDALEEIWTKRMEEGAEDLPFFFALAAAVKKKGSGSKALSWLRFLADDGWRVGRRRGAHPRPSRDRPDVADGRDRCGRT